MAGWSGEWSASVLELCLADASGKWFSARRRSRAMPKTNSGPSTLSRSREHSSSICWSSRMSARTVLLAFKPDTGCRAHVRLLAMGQLDRAPAQPRPRRAVALLRRHRPHLQVCPASAGLATTARRSLGTDLSSRSRMAGSCSSSTASIDSLGLKCQGACRRAGAARSTSFAHTACRAWSAQTVGWSACALIVEPPPQRRQGSLMHAKGR